MCLQENPQPPYEQDALAIGTFHAIQRGIFVACAAGNSGQQGAGTAGNLAPWLITVAASSTDRVIGVDVSLGNGAVHKASSRPLSSHDVMIFKKFSSSRHVCIDHEILLKKFHAEDSKKDFVRTAAAAAAMA